MAAIDKYYTSSYEEYRLLQEWAEDKTVLNAEGETLKVKDYVYSHWDKEDFDGEERPICNTPTVVDRYMYFNCPFDFIHEWIENTYSKRAIKKWKENENMKM